MEFNDQRTKKELKSGSGSNLYEMTILRYEVSDYFQLSIISNLIE